jgi:hypothetical protein
LFFYTFLTRISVILFVDLFLDKFNKLLKEFHEKNFIFYGFNCFISFFSCKFTDCI